MSGTSTPAATIVAATDFSPASRLAVEQAAMLASSRGAELRLVHVLGGGVWASLRQVYAGERRGGGGPASAERRRQRLSEWAGELAERHGIAAAWETRSGRPETEIADFVHACSAGLLVLGEHEGGLLADALPGSTTLKAFDRADVPVLIVRRPAQADFSRILAAVDFSEPAARAARQAASLFPGAELILAHAYPEQSADLMRLDGASPDEIAQRQQAARGDAEARMRHFIQKIGLPPGTSVSVDLAGGQPDYAIVGRAQRLAADLIAIGRHGQGYLDERLFGSTTQHVLRDARSNVLLVP